MSEFITCKKCNTQNRFSAKFCRHCGQSLSVLNVSDEKQNLPEAKTLSQNQPVQNELVNDSVSANEISSDYIGLSEIRLQLKNFINTLRIKNQQKKIGMPVMDSTSILVFWGETGTGKSLVNECFVRELLESGCLCSQKIEFTSAHKMKRLFKFDSDISKFILEQQPGVLCIDEIHNDVNYLHEILLGLTEKKSDTICVLCGIREPLEKFFEEKSELRDLVTFYDFPSVSSENLCLILEKKLREKGFAFDSDVQSLFERCVQEAKSNPSNSYKNGWIVEKEILNKIFENQASRLSSKQNLSSDDLKRLLPSDIPVSKKLETVDEILSQLNELVGMETVKTAIRELCQTVINNQRRKAVGLTAENPKVHIILTGNPGTGKTTVARILSRLFYSMKLLPGDKFREVDGLGLTAGFVGQTKDKVNKLCDEAMGGVLFIDEAYYLAGSGGNNSYGEEATGTILKRMEDDRGKFIIIAAGYQEEMNSFLKMNPGLASRFQYKIHIEDYSASELFEIFELMVKKASFCLTEEAAEKVRAAIESFCKNKDKNFANARKVRNFFDEIRFKMDSRIACLPDNLISREILTTIEAEDIPFEEEKHSTIEEIFAELNELIGMEKVKSAVRELYDSVKINLEMEKLGQAPKRPEIHFILTGNPGTGKTTVARILGKLFFAMGLLQKTEIIEADRSKIVGRFLGHTAGNMQNLCDNAMGGVLFIDEVYTLSTDEYGREATDTLMKRMEDDRGKFIVVVAGYADRMQEWLSVNEGLSSRFTHTIHLDDYNSDELFELFCLYAKKEKLNLSGGAEIEARTLLHYIWENRGTDFANGRTVRKIYDAVVRKKNSRIIKLSEEERTKEVLTTITEEDFNFKE